MVAEALAALGRSSLEIQYAMHVAWRGANCWETDNQVRQFLRGPSGRPPHRESIGRIRRNLARLGVVTSERVMPFQKPRGAKFRTSHGTTNKAVAYDRLGLRNPLTRAEKREARAQQPTPATPRPVQKPRFSAPVVVAQMRELDRGELARMLGPAWQELDRRMNPEPSPDDVAAQLELERESVRGPPE